MYNTAFATPIARFATRPSGRTLDNLTETNITPDLIMGTLLRSGAHLLESNTIYELILNELTGVMELHKVGKSHIGKKWGRAYYDIPVEFGPQIWLTEEELKSTKEVEEL